MHDFGCVAPRQGATIVIDFPGSARRTFTQPVGILEAVRLDDVAGVIEAAAAAAGRGLHAAGFVTYEAAAAFDPALQTRARGTLPFAWFALFDTPANFVPPVSEHASPAWQIESDADAFGDAVARIREEIAAGRTYQLNLTTRLSAVTEAANAFGLYEALRRGQGSGYHAFIDTPHFQILSASPELFFELRGRHIRTQPMKGTRPRGRYGTEDEALRLELAGSEKDRAENLMIVDLLRNDLGRIATPGSVHVESLFDVERYRTVHQMTSRIDAVLREDVSLGDVFAALFPCGSVTGAPKISTMSLINELEPAAREVYCGAIGIIEPGGAATFNVAIRTLWTDRQSGRATYGAGAGITYDSEPRAEYDEVIAKAAVLTEPWPDFELLETMRLENGALVRRERHIARLLASAGYFDIRVCEADLLRALDSLPCTGAARVRLLVDLAGAVRTEVHPLDALPDDPVACLAAGPIDASNRFLFHKTTNRRVYEAVQSDGFDVLLWNQQGEITEFTRGNVVVEIDGALLTPALACGLLPGTFRAELLDSGRVHEAVIPRAELARASRVWFVNSVREWVPIRMLAS